MTKSTESLSIIRKRYADFGPTLAAEKLSEIHDIRRPCRGELIQIDGSPYDWFEGCGPKCTLLVFVDDATSEIGEPLTRREHNS